MFCRHCGKEINDNSKFCGFCGKSVEKSSSKKISLVKDEDIVYLDSDDDTEFSDYDFDDVDNFNYEDDFNYNKNQNNNKKNNNKLIAILSCIILVLVMIFIVFKLNIFDKINNQPVASISNVDSYSDYDENEEYIDEESYDEEFGEENENSSNEDLENKIDKNENISNTNQTSKPKTLNKINILYSECSSILHDTSNKNYDSTKVLDNDFSTVWSEGVSGYGSGEWIKLEFDSTYTVKKIKIVNGLVNKKNGYYNNNRPESLTLQFSDGSSQTVYLEDNNTGYQVIDINEVDTYYVKFVINSVYYGSKYDDTCIADIQILGY